MKINTIDGNVEAKDLGKTLMHEHLVTAFRGGRATTALQGAGGARDGGGVLDRIAELKDAGFRTMLVPVRTISGAIIPLMAGGGEQDGFQHRVRDGAVSPSPRRHGVLEHQVSAAGADATSGWPISSQGIDAGVMDTGIKAGVIKIATARAVHRLREDDLPRGGDCAKATARRSRRTPMRCWATSSWSIRRRACRRIAS